MRHPSRKAPLAAWHAHPIVFAQRSGSQRSGCTGATMGRPAMAGPSSPAPGATYGSQGGAKMSLRSRPSRAKGVLCARSSRVRVVASAQWCAGTARGKIASNILMTTITHEIYETKREDSVSCRCRRQIRLSGSGDSGILLRLWRAGGSVTKERRAAAVGLTTDTPSPKRGRPGIRAKRPAPGAGTIWRRARPYLAWSTISAPRAADRRSLHSDRSP